MKFDKSFFKSKTLYVALFTIVAGFFPVVQELVSKYPEVSTTVAGVVFGFLRITATKKLVVKADKELE